MDSQRHWNTGTLHPQKSSAQLHFAPQFAWAVDQLVELGMTSIPPFLSQMWALQMASHALFPLSSPELRAKQKGALDPPWRRLLAALALLESMTPQVLRPCAKPVRAAKTDGHNMRVRRVREAWNGARRESSSSSACVCV
eukprot:scpid24269/ scgid29966/ 